MWRALVLVSVAACWVEEPRVDGTFTQEQWEVIQSFRLPPPQLCPTASLAGGRQLLLAIDCEAAARLGQRLFFDKRLSGMITIEDSSAVDRMGTAQRIACANCHDPEGYFVDTRSVPGNVSVGAGYTKRNALSLVNTGYKAVQLESCALGDKHCGEGFSWAGGYRSPGEVLLLATGAAAMNSSAAQMADVARTSRDYIVEYTAAFGIPPRSNDGCPSEKPRCSDAEVYANLGVALDAYFRRLNSEHAPIDRYAAGQLDALEPDEKRGLAVFIGKGMCVECHKGPLFSDLQFHNTGVPQRGPRVPDEDLGLGKTTDDRANDGKFLTQPLRHAEKTAPYMHAGQFAQLIEVIDFYRWGGALEGFSGTKDVRLQALEIDDDDARDLEAFLRRPLTGEPVEDALRVPPPTSPPGAQ